MSANVCILSVGMSHTVNCRDKKAHHIILGYFFLLTIATLVAMSTASASLPNMKGLCRHDDDDDELDPGKMDIRNNLCKYRVFQQMCPTETGV